MNDRQTELILIEGADGILAIGTDADLDEWQASAGQDAGEITRTGLGREARSAVGELLPLATELSTAFLPHGRNTDRAEVRLVTRGKDGRFTSSTRLNPMQLAQVARLNPKLILMQAAVHAVTSALAEIRESLDEVREGVDELLRAADADRLGDVYGRHRILLRMAGEVSDGRHLTTTDWQAVASLGPALEVGTERLRRHLISQLSTLGGDSAPRARARALKRLVDPGRVGDLLKLLVTAEESLALYQRLRLERTSHEEPGAIGQTVDSIRHILDENLVLDTRLAVELRRVLNEVAVLEPAEGWDLVSRRSLDRHRAALAAEVDEFLARRQAQAGQWELRDSANFRDALVHYREIADDLGRATRRGMAKGLGSLARRIDPS